MGLWSAQSCQMLSADHFAAAKHIAALLATVFVQDMLKAAKDGKKKGKKGKGKKKVRRGPLGWWGH